MSLYPCTYSANLCKQRHLLLQVLSDHYQITEPLPFFPSKNIQTSGIKFSAATGEFKRKKKTTFPSIFSGKAPGVLTGPQLHYLVPPVHTFKSHPG